jgi:hypothetical protein
MGAPGLAVETWDPPRKGRLSLSERPSQPHQKLNAVKGAAFESRIQPTVRDPKNHFYARRPVLHSCI